MSTRKPARRSSSGLDAPLFRGATETHLPELSKPHGLDWYLGVPEKLAEAEAMQRKLARGLEWWKAELVGICFERFGDVHEGSQLYGKLEDTLGLKYGTINALRRAYDTFPDPEKRIPDVGPYVHAQLGNLEPDMRDAIVEPALDAAQDHDQANWTVADIRAEKKRLTGVEERPRPSRDDMEHEWRRLIRNARPASFAFLEVPEDIVEDMALRLDEPLPEHDPQGTLDG